jgi:hypothetical protein
MYLSVRKYRVDPDRMDELMHRVDETFAPRLEAMDGFVAYQVFDAGSGILYSTTCCHDEDAVEQSVALASAFVREDLADFDIERLEVAFGEIAVSRARSEVLEPAHA